MNLKLEVLENKKEKLGSGTYNENDLYLEYSIDYFVSLKQVFLIFDTLTISFDYLSKEFISLDSYTNKKNWEYKDKIELPNIEKNGLLKLFDDYNERDRYSFSYKPIYIYSGKEILKIKLTDNDDGAHFFKIAQDLVVGIRDFEITSFILLKIHF